MPPRAYRLYVRPGPAVNSYAAGRRSVAVTEGLLTEIRARRLSHGHLEALLVHELGHHATGSTRYVLATRWWAAPWRITYRAVLRIACAFAAQQPFPLLGVVVVAALGIALHRLVADGLWAAAALMVTVLILAVVIPLADAATDRRSEWDADRHAAELGVARELAAALGKLAASSASQPRRVWWTRALDSHPSTAERVHALSRP